MKALDANAGRRFRACKSGQTVPEEVRDLLFKCVSHGTHCANHFIEEIYRQLKEEINEP